MTRQTTDDLLATVEKRWPNALRTDDPVISDGEWAGAVQVWTIPVLPIDDGYLLPNFGVSDTPLRYATLERAEKAARRAFDNGNIYG